MRSYFILSLLALVPFSASAALTQDLKMGDSGNEVKELQSILNAEGYAVTSFGSETMYFGTKTKDALTKYQERYRAELSDGISDPVTGTLTPATRSHINNKINRGAVLGATTGSQFQVNLKQGMTHPDVRRLQKFLNQAGYPVATSGVGSAGNEGTYFGPATTNALKRYQETYRKDILGPTSIPGSATGNFYDATRAFVNKQLGQ